MSRPDITEAVIFISQFTSQPTIAHWNAMLKVVRYLKHTRSSKLIYRSSIHDTAAYCDADWGTNSKDRKSFSGYIIRYKGCTISWCTKKQTAIALSTMEAEYTALTLVAKEVLWIKSFSLELHFENDLSIYCDNRAAIVIASNPTDHSRAKHIDIKLHFIRDYIKNNTLSIKYIATSANIADLSTKALPSGTFKQHVNNFGVQGQEGC
jgi:hypothetical protein